MPAPPPPRDPKGPTSAEGFANLAPGPRFAAAGAIGRRLGASGVKVDVVDGALRSVEARDVGASLLGADAEKAVAALAVSLDEGFEAMLADQPDERAMWASSCLRTLETRDGLASLAWATARWEALGGVLDEAGSRARDGLVKVLEAGDRRLAPRARMLAAVNEERRRERDRLDAAERDAAWWYSARAGCDTVVAIVTSLGAVDRVHVSSCRACQRDVDAARVISTVVTELSPGELAAAAELEA